VPSCQRQARKNSLLTLNPQAVWSEATILIGAAVVTTALPFFRYLSRKNQTISGHSYILKSTGEADLRVEPVA
jgi:hypothetical protein